jgi:hypothetical protein
MAISRYRNVEKLENRKHYGTLDLPTKKRLDQIDTIKLVMSETDRLDTLAARYFGAGEYWWVIAVMNGIEWPLKIPAGTIIKIPIDLEEVLNLF